MPDLFIPPHAGVRVVVEDLGKLRSGLAAMGLLAPAIDAAIDMLTRQSMKIAALTKDATP